ncbi:hypothetical protein Pmani_037046 [Petrolisthes manimaculis]|uniref:HARP domain-containing protein n=1 Tax=Petrolisthes manimaculis TaxID=1843537 RepID=A0AAE1TLV0_9EUCA|nr:hypothetical protein Pmani_037046 [Petrolisthes manimaculis]
MMGRVGNSNAPRWHFTVGRVGRDDGPSCTMSGLSEEQRRRMEENRQRALQKRLKLQATSNTDNKTSQPFHSATTTNPHNVLEGPNILRPSNVIPEGSVFSNISRPSHFPKVIPEGSNISRPSNSPNFIPDDQVILKPSNPMSSNFSKHSNDVVVGALHCTDIARGPVTSYDTSITKTRQHSASSNTSPCDTNLIMKQPNSTIYELLSSGISNNFPRPPISKQLLHSSNLPKANTGFQPPGSKRSPPLDTKSEDARKRIEENRRRALERRAASKGITAIPNAEAPFSAKPATSFYSTGQTKTSNDSMRRGTDLVKPSSDNLGENMGRMKPVMGPSGVLDSPGRKTTDAGNAQGTTKAIFGRTINGTFRLTCPERFIVDAPFHHQMVEIFKTLDTKMYDPMTQKWNFSVKEHDKLVSALAPLRPAVCISPLPAFVRKVLQSSEKQVPASCIDLFGLDPKLLEALMPFQHDGVWVVVVVVVVVVVKINWCDSNDGYGSGGGEEGELVWESHHSGGSYGGGVVIMLMMIVNDDDG